MVSFDKVVTTVHVVLAYGIFLREFYLKLQMFNNLEYCNTENM
jgi:hypothetical protein